MVNNVNPTASKLLEQIKRLSIPQTSKNDNSIDFKKDVMNKRTNTIDAHKGANLLNAIEKIQKKNDVAIQSLENIKKASTEKNIQTIERPIHINTGKNIRREALGSFLDIYL